VDHRSADPDKQMSRRLQLRQVVDNGLKVTTRMSGHSRRQPRIDGDDEQRFLEKI
jgi:hypothetical protein